MLGRVGGYGKNTPINLMDYNENWLLVSATVGATIILSVLLLTYVLGTTLPIKMVRA